MVGQCDIDLRPLHWPLLCAGCYNWAAEGQALFCPSSPNPGRKEPRTWRVVWE
jgi:hypothetical protein